MTSIAPGLNIHFIHQSLKRTAVVLADHEEALKGKLHTTQKEVESERYTQVIPCSINYRDCIFQIGAK